MVSVYKISTVGFTSESYLLTVDGKNAVAIDPSHPQVVEKAEEKGLRICAVLLTHGHFDHVGACFALSAAGVPIYCAAAEKELVNGRDSMYFAYDYPVPTFAVKAVLEDKDEIMLAGITFSVIATPGHTAGSVTYRVENGLFVGDTLFLESVGRCDLPTGNFETLRKSVKKLYDLEGDFIIYPGHGPNTTLQHERGYNPFIKA